MPNDDNQVYEPQNSYQDDIDSADDQVDPIIDEETDDPTEGFGVPAASFKDELDRMEGHSPDAPNDEYDSDDMREHIEDLDEDDRDRD